MTTHEWLSTVIGAVGTASGWAMYVLEKRRAREKEALEERRAREKDERAVLDGFLYPLQSILKQNKRSQQDLLKDSKFRELEYSVDYIQECFSSLPDTDWRRVGWKHLIEDMLEGNGRALRLIEVNSSKIRRDDFRRSCDEFTVHAKQWSAYWRGAIGNEPVPDELRGVDKLMTPPFPPLMDEHLRMEITDRCREAGSQPITAEEGEHSRA
jgi:hypothetical protein